MIQRPEGMGALEFAVVSSLRAAQLTRGCAARVPASNKPAITAQREVAEGKIERHVDE